MDAVKFWSHLMNVDVENIHVGKWVPSILEINMKDGSCLVVFSAWRMEQKDVVLLTNTDADAIGRDSFLDKLKILASKKILGIDMSAQFDLKIIFEEGYCIKTFSDISYFQTENGGDWDANWRLAIPKCNVLVCATNDFRLKIEEVNE